MISSPAADLAARWHHWHDFRTFHQLHLSTGDIDPAYPVLRRVVADDPPSLQIWAVLLHVAFYHLGSALAAYAACPIPAMPPLQMLQLPVATERRNLRDPLKLYRHLQALLDHVNQHGSFANWLRPHLAGGYPAIYAAIQATWGNGRWATYKTCEMLADVVGGPYTVARPPDMGHHGSSGPRHGLQLVSRQPLPTGNRPTDIATLNRRSDQLCTDLAHSGLTARACQVETSLCDFHAMATGRYYPGHDIDQQQQQLNQVPSAHTAAAHTARAAVFPPEYLGELGGWHGIDRQRRTAYQRTGVIPTRPDQ